MKIVSKLSCDSTQLRFIAREDGKTGHQNVVSDKNQDVSRVRPHARLSSDHQLVVASVVTS